MAIINHARTLLLNSEPLDGPGSEYTPAYTPKVLPLQLQQIWDLLFGTNSSATAKNYRALQLMTMLHSFELEKYVLALDPRITYMPPNEVCCAIRPDELPSLTTIVEYAEHIFKYGGSNYLFSGTSPYMVELAQYWNNHPVYCYRLSALVLALIYKIEELNEVEGR